MDELTPGSNPRRGVIAVLAAVAVAAVTVALVQAGTSSTVAASGLESFSSCAEVAAWGRTSASRAEPGVIGSPTAPGALATADLAARGPEPAGQPAPVEGGTNVAVPGVDELDLVERLGGDRALFTSGDRLVLVDLAAGRLVDAVAVPASSQVTYDAEHRVAWVVGTGDGHVRVRRVEVGPDSLSAGAAWSTSGALVDARRVGGRLHVVATEGFAAPGAGPVVPFADGPVPCREVLHPIGPSVPQATLLVTLPATGALAPEHATEVVGAGQFVHVTSTAAYLATPLWDKGDVTGIHRFDLGTLTHTGSGRVDGHLLDGFSMSEHDRHLRVAVTTGFGGPVPMGGVLVDGPDRAVAAEPSEPVASGVPVAPVAPGVPAPDPGPHNQVVVLDTDGALDVVGRSPRFGHAGETLRGIRFSSTVAYAVTFVQTDPFYVLDLTDPRDPKVTGSVELPGFSSYLHPISDSLVAGFGPGGDGRAAVRLFDVSDPTRPRVADQLVLGDQSAVVGDHHAFVDLGGGRFAVPSSTFGGGPVVDCTRLDAAGACPGTAATIESAVVVVATDGGRLREVERHTVRANEPVDRVVPSGSGWSLRAGSQLLLLDEAGAPRTTLALS